MMKSIFLCLVCFLACFTFVSTIKAEEYLQQPKNDAEEVSCFPDFLWGKDTWSVFQESGTFEIQISKDGEFRNIIVNDIVEIPRYVPSEPLEAGEDYFWRVRYFENNVKGEWSETAKFTTANYENLVLAIDASKSIEQVREIFEEAKSSAPATVMLTEDVSWSAEEIDLLNLKNYKNVWFNGNGKNISITNPQNRLFHLDHCVNMIFSNFSVDYSPLTHVPCEVVAVDLEKNQITLKTLQTPGNLSLELNDPVVLSADKQHMRLLDKENPGLIKFNSETYIHAPNLKYVNSFEDSGTLYHNIQFITSRYSASDFTVGDYMLKVIRGNSRNTMRAYASQHIAFYKVTAYASPSQFVSSIDGSGLIVQNCEVVLKEGRYSSVTADNIYVRRNEIGPWVVNNVFVANGDDCMNLHSIAAKIISEVDDNTLEFQKSNFNRMDIGDSVAIWDPYPGTTDPIYTSVKSKDESSNTITFNDLVGGLKLEEEDFTLNTCVYNITKSNRRFYIKNNLIKDNSRFGILLSSQDGAILNNTFEQCASSGIRIGNLPGEGLNTRNVLIKGNTFINCGYTKSYFDDELAVIQITAYGGKYKEVPLKFHEKISIIDNTIIDWESVAVKIRGGVDVLVEGNKIQSEAKSEFQNPNDNNNVFVVGNATNVTIKNNVLNDYRKYNNILKEEEGVSGLKVEMDQNETGLYERDRGTVKLTKHGDIIRIKLPNQEVKNCTMNLFDCVGRNIIRKKFSGGTLSFNCSSLIYGVYIIGVETPSQIITRKIFIG